MQPISADAISMQDTDPNKRPGAGSDGYAALKMHPFFLGVNWKNPRAASAPRPALESNVSLIFLGMFCS